MVAGRKKAEQTARIWTRTFLYTMFITAMGGFLLSGLNSVVPLHMEATFGPGSAGFSGTLNTCFTACAVVARLGGGHLCDLWGRKKVMICGAFICAFATAAYIYASTRVALLCVFRGLQGLGYAAVCIGAQTMMLGGLPRERLSEGIGYFSVGQTIIGSVAPMIGLGILGDGRFSLTYLVFACAILSVIPAAMLCSSGAENGEETRHEEERVPAEVEQEVLPSGFLWRIFEKSAVPATVIQTCITFGTAAISILLTLFATHKGFEHVALFFTIQSFAALFARIISGRYGDKYGLLPCFAIGLALMSMSFFIIALTENDFVYCVTGAIYGIGGGIVSPVMQKQAVYRAPKKRLGAANGTFMISADLGTGLSGIVWGTCMDILGDSETFLMIGAWMALVLVCGSIYLIVNKKRERPSVAQ